MEIESEYQLNSYQLQFKWSPPGDKDNIPVAYAGDLHIKPFHSEDNLSAVEMESHLNESAASDAPIVANPFQPIPIQKRILVADDQFFNI